MIDFGLLFQNATVAGVPLLLFVIALVQWVKTAFPNLAGNTVRVVAMVVGLLLGVGYQMTLGMPSGAGGAFAIVIFGLMLGLGASGAYDALTTAVLAARPSGPAK